MHLSDGLLSGRDCVACPSQAPTCSCGVGYQCITTSRSCSACPTTSCVAAAGGNSSSGGGVSAGAIAGAVIGAILALSASIALLIWYRRRQRLEKSAAPQTEVKSDVPARAEAVLSRPDPVEKPGSPFPQEPESVRMYSVMSNSTINLDPQAQHPSPSASHPSARRSVQSNPFTDTHSIQTTSASTQSTNVIPIALVPHGSVSSPPYSPASDQQSGLSSIPSRPSRAPDLGLRFDPLSSSLNLEHVNVSKDSFRPPNVPYANSQASGFSGISSRDSVMTSGSFASDMLYEAPQIVTSTGGGALRQVLGVAKAEVISAPGTTPNTPMSSESLKPNTASHASKPPARSPLAQSSFGPHDTLSESDIEGQDIEYHTHNPFGDEHTPGIITGRSTFGGRTPVPLPSTASPSYDTFQRREQNYSSVPRPTSTLTQAASIIGAEIAGATFVRLNSLRSTQTAQNRMTSAKLVSPSSAPLRPQDDRVLQEQQAQALAVARARAVASGLPPPPNPRRVSEASVASAGGDSLLESFTFVPPSPISNRPPRSPLGQQAAFANPQLKKDEEQLNTPSSRQMLGMSTASTNSSLEGYTFHIDQGQGSAPPMPAIPDSAIQPQTGVQAASPAFGSKSPPSSSGEKRAPRQRASLDTLALTADLSAFPLNFDEVRGSFSVSK